MFPTRSKDDAEVEVVVAAAKAAAIAVVEEEVKSTKLEPTVPHEIAEEQREI